MWRGGVGRAYPLSDPFVCRCLTSSSMLRFHIPLIEPDVRFSRIRLSDKDSRVRTRKVTRSPAKPDETEGLVEIRVGVPCRAPTRRLVLAA